MHDGRYEAVWHGHMPCALYRHFDRVVWAARLKVLAFSRTASQAGAANNVSAFFLVLLATMGRDTSRLRDI